MQVFTAIEYRLSSGEYIIQVTTTGTASLAISLDGGGTFQQITDVSYTANADGVLKLPSCSVKPTLTGDAVMFLNKVD